MSELWSIDSDASCLTGGGGAMRRREATDFLCGRAGRVSWHPPRPEAYGATVLETNLLVFIAFAHFFLLSLARRALFLGNL